MRIKHFVFICFVTANLHSADWVMLQGIQNKPGHYPWGFLQIRYEQNYGEKAIIHGINKAPFSYIKPTLQKQSELQIARARLGIRGSFCEANNINYFILTEVAQNGVNNPLGEYTPTYLTDASLTFKYLPIYLRVGKFKYAGSEEGQMARFVSPFINFSNVGNQLMLERFVSSTLSKPIQGVGAYRDTGLQLFKKYSFGNQNALTLSYMLGNGSGTSNTNINNNNFTHYGYVSYEKTLGDSKGYHQESLKLYTWMQVGKRLLNNELYNRDRYGAGFTYFDNDLRIEGEYMQGSGMIVSGVKDNSNDENINDWVYSMSPSYKNKANGYYLLSTYEFFKDTEIIARYDVYNRLTNDNTNYRKFETITSGISYKFHNYNRVDINYAFNKIRAPKNHTADTFLDSKVGNILNIQFTMLIK